jgi:hypothetical protein
MKSREQLEQELRANRIMFAAMLDVLGVKEVRIPYSKMLSVDENSALVMEDDLTGPDLLIIRQHGLRQVEGVQVTPHNHSGVRCEAGCPVFDEQSEETREAARKSLLSQLLGRVEVLEIALGEARDKADKRFEQDIDWASSVNHDLLQLRDSIVKLEKKVDAAIDVQITSMKAAKLV